MIPTPVSRRRAALAAAIIAAGAAAVWILSRLASAPAPDDADLLAPLPPVASAQNAFTYLNQAAAVIFWPRAREKEIVGLLSSNGWNAELATELLAKNTAALDLLDQAVACPVLRVPPVQQLNDEDESSYFLDWRKIARLSTIRSSALFHAGKTHEAFEEALRLVRLGHLAENSGGPIVHYMRSGATKWMGLEQLRKLNAQTALPCGELTSLIAGLEQCRANGAGITNSIKAEYQLTLKWFEDLRSGRGGPTNSLAYTVGTRHLAVIMSKNRALFGAAAHAYLRSVPLPFSARQVPERPPDTNSSPLRLFLRGNAMGEIIHDMIAPAWKGILVRKCQENVNVTATQTLLALRCWQQEHGSLPGSLAELVPGLLPAVPLDDFDGKPLRYRPERRLLYSVGKDLIDSGGAAISPGGSPQDLPFDIEF